MRAHGFSPHRAEFTLRAEWRREEKERVAKQVAEKASRDKERERDRIEDQSDLMDFAFSFIVATESDIAAFTAKLDTYDAATIRALEVNREALERAQEEIRIMLDKAYVLPDGRRVFKTEDGLRVFDEFGEEIEDVDPNEIEDWRPHWEEYRARVEKEEELLAEREELIEYQEKLDEAREGAKAGMPKDELDELERILEAEKPEAVRRELGEATAPAMNADQTAALQPEAVFRPTVKLDMPPL